MSISDDQRRPCPDWNWLSTVHHGLPPELYPFARTPAAAISPSWTDLPQRSGRITDRDRAACRRPLKIAAKVDRVDQVYFDEVIRPCCATH